MRWFFLILIFTAVVARGAGLTSSPTSQPSTEFDVHSPVRAWFGELASEDMVKRDEARTQLMGLVREDLPRLKMLVEKSRPLAAEQAAALHEIVLQIYLSGEPYAADESKGFLGLQNLYMGTARMGTTFQNRVPGFPSFQILRDGDIILGVFVHPEAPIQQLPNMNTPNGDVLQHVISGVGANRTVVLEVLRQGQTIRVPIRLKGRPILSEDLAADIQVFFSERLQKGEAYWEKEFAPMLRAGIS